MGEEAKTLRVAMIGQKHIPSREGGVEVVVEALATRMVRLGHRVTCFNRAGHHVAGARYDAPALREYEGVLLKSVPTLSIRGLSAATSAFFGAAAAAFGPYDIVHFHAEGPAFICWLPKLMGKRVIVTVHGLDHRREKWGKAARAFIMLGERSAAYYADEIIVLSRAAQEYFRNRYGRQTRYIPNGVERRERRPSELVTRAFGLRPEGYILFLSRVVPEKGLRRLIEAFGRVKTQKRLVIAGGPSDTGAFLKELRRLAKSDERVLFTGFVQGRVKHELYSNAYVYVLPSDVEGMPLSLLEAMSYGNCCLVSDIAECKEVVEDRAVTFRQGDALDLARKLQMLCDSPELVGSYKAAASAFICGKYSWEETVSKTLELYRGGAAR